MLSESNELAHESAARMLQNLLLFERHMIRLFACVFVRDWRGCATTGALSIVYTLAQDDKATQQVRK
jgi:hypothetical protein